MLLFVPKLTVFYISVDFEIPTVALFCAKATVRKWSPDMGTYGYARVSTDGQTLASQEAALAAAGCTKVFAEKISGARSKRRQLAKLLKAVSEGDTVVVTRLDRLVSARHRTYLTFWTLSPRPAPRSSH
jgi:predicted site-specific integrase-resolvase